MGLLKSLFVHLFKAATIVAIFAGAISMAMALLSDKYFDFLIDHAWYGLISIFCAACTIFWAGIKISHHQEKIGAVKVS